MAWLVFLYALTLGVEQSNMISELNPGLEWYGYTELEASMLILNTLEIGGSSTIRIKPRQIPFFTPMEAEFVFFTQLRYKMISVGYEHNCYHNFQDYYTRNGQEYNRFYLCISNKE